MKYRVKHTMVRLCMFFMKIIWIFPIKEKVVLFSSFNGTQYSDSPKYLSEYINNTYKDHDVYWVIDDVNKIPRNLGYHIINKRNKLMYFFYMCCAKTIIVNDMMESYIPIRKGQIVLNTWHGGGALKPTGMLEKNVDPNESLFYINQRKKYTAFLSSSELITTLQLKQSFLYDKLILPTGLPRNDILLNNHEEAIDKVYQYYGLKRTPDVSLVLYAPTYRGKVADVLFLPKEQMLSVEDTKQHLERKFKKKFIFLFRGHHAMHHTLREKELIDATSYPDMQELLCAADVLITDYSSCGHDFSLMHKPVFSYIPDVETYLTSRGFMRDIRSLPFQYALDMNGLKNRIMEYDEEKYCLELEKYFSDIGNYDDGNAIKKTCSWLESKWNK